MDEDDGVYKVYDEEEEEELDADRTAWPGSRNDTYRQYTYMECNNNSYRTSTSYIKSQSAKQTRKRISNVTHRQTHNFAQQLNTVRPGKRRRKTKNTSRYMVVV